MLKICGDSIRVPLEMILSKLFLLVCFFLNEKKEILFPFTKRATNKILKIIDQFLYFRYVVKYLKDLILTKFLSIFPLINLSWKTESGFQRRDSCINQLLSITHEISTSFDNGV